VVEQAQEIQLRQDTLTQRQNTLNANPIKNDKHIFRGLTRLHSRNQMANDEPIEVTILLVHLNANIAYDNFR
jgi:hypothetical protein